MKMNDIVKSTAMILAIVVVFSAAMFALNFHTGPMIEANNKGAEFAPLLAVMPEGASFDGNALITDTLTGLPESVIAVYKEANGLGFAVRCKASSQYSKTPMEITIGVTADGKICGLQLDGYTDSIDFRSKDASYIDSFLGKDSALADVSLVAGCTFSSTAFKNAVSDGLSALIVNSLIAEGVKSPAQILTELIPTVHTGLASGSALKCDPVEGSGNIQSGFKGINGSGFAYIMTKGEESYLAVTNMLGGCNIYNVEGADVTADHADLVTEALAHTNANGSSLAEAANTKFTAMMPGATDMKPLTVNATNTVVAASEFKVGDATYYGFYSRSFGFGGHEMDVYVVIDANGAIAKLDAKTFIFEEDYFNNFGGMDVNAYRDGFKGLTSETFDGSQAIIATATMTSNAIKQSTNDAFAAFKAITVNGGDAK